MTRSGKLGDEAVALASHAGVFLFHFEGGPAGHLVAFGDGAVGFCQAVDVHGPEVEVFHRFEEVRCWWGGGDGYADGFCDGWNAMVSFLIRLGRC